MSGSSSAIARKSADRSRYTRADLLLKAFIGRDGSTAKEIAKDVLGWSDDAYADSPKRAGELKKVGYLVEVGNRKCKKTGMNAQVFDISDKGIRHLVAKGMYKRAAGAVVDVTVDSGVKNIEVGRDRLAELKFLLGS